MGRLFRITWSLALAVTLLAGPFSLASAAEKKAGPGYPQKGKVLTIIVPYNAGGGADTDARLIAPLLEKKLGISVQVVNKPGAGTQVGMTELTSAKPDGYTLLLGHFPGSVTTYCDPARQTPYSRKDIKAVAFTCAEPFCFFVKKDSPYKTMKDVVEYAKANPEKFKVSVTGLLLPPHLSVLELQKVSGAKFAPVNFDGSAPGRTAFLGGHTDGIVALVSEGLGMMKADQARMLGVMDQERTFLVPEIPTMIQQGYKVLMPNTEGILAPGQTPSSVIKVLEKAFKAVTVEPSYQEKMKQLGITVRFKNAAESEEWLTRLENQVRPLIEEVRKQQK
jgi:tripartite-type tricarboxylate transporter receptor subunit TctC